MTLRPRQPRTRKTTRPPALDTPGVADRSYWLTDALGVEPIPGEAEHLSSSIRTDVCIVGGGFTGLWTAIELKQREPSIEVVLLEAALCGSGASGTNAGLLMNLWPKLPALLRAGGRSEGVDVARASVEAIEHIKRFCSEYKIDAQLETNGWLWASTNSSQDGAWHETLLATAPYPGSPFVEVDQATATALAGAPVRGGVLDSTCMGIHPGRLVRGLRAAAHALGVAIYEYSPMTAMTSEHGATTVRTPNGTVRAESVVLAINAWCIQFPALRKHLMMTASDNVVVQPGKAMTAAPLTNVSDAGRLLDYWRSLTDGKILFGKAGVGLGWRVRGANTLFRPVPNPENLIGQMIRSVPGLVSSDVIASWRAPVEYSVSSLPFFGELPGHRGVYFGTGYSGDGIGPSVLGARILASLATRVVDGLSASFLTRLPTGRRLPPEPVRFIGGQLVKTAMLRQDRLQDEGRRVDFATNLLARVDPTSFVG